MRRNCKCFEYCHEKKTIICIFDPPSNQIIFGKKTLADSQRETNMIARRVQGTRQLPRESEGSQSHLKRQRRRR